MFIFTRVETIRSRAINLIQWKSCRGYLELLKLATAMDIPFESLPQHAPWAIEWMGFLFLTFLHTPLFVGVKGFKCGTPQQTAKAIATATIQRREHGHTFMCCRGSRPKITPWSQIHWDIIQLDSDTVVRIMCNGKMLYNNKFMRFTLNNLNANLLIHAFIIMPYFTLLYNAFLQVEICIHCLTEVKRCCIRQVATPSSDG